MKKSILICLILAAAAFPLLAQSSSPTVDGTVGASEYAQSHSDSGVEIYSTFTSDKIYLAITAPGTGWVAIGLGSNVMNGATIFMGYVDDNGRMQFSVQKGRFHTHSPISDQTPVAEAMSESAGKTTLELELNRADFVDNGQTTLDYIYAYNRTAKNFRTRHNFRNSSTMVIK
ncbi:hypothetical protein [Salinispira pacifica]